MIEVVLCSLIGPDLKLGYVAQLCKTHISVLRAVGEPVTYQYMCRYRTVVFSVGLTNA